MTKATCSIEGCDKPFDAKDLCGGHYRRLRIHGDPQADVPLLDRTVRPAIERFWGHIKPGDWSDCWLWDNPAPNGYGTLGVGSRKDASYRSLKAHRFAYEWFVRPIPEGMEVDHLCHDPQGCKLGDGCPHRACVNPDHLETVTPLENTHRSGGNATKTRCKWGHPFDEWNTAIYGGVRFCRTCMRRRDAERRQRQRAKNERM